MAHGHAILRLGDLDTLRMRCRALAALDAIMSPEWEYRRYSYDPQWSPGETMASMRNGSGDEWFLVFADGIGAGLKGLDHESAAYRRHQGTDALVRCVPPVLGPAFSQEAAFTMTHASFVGWYLQSDGTWRAADETAGDDGADWLLTHLLTDAATYAKWASDYYETHVDAGAASRVFGGEPVSAELAGTLGSNEPWSEIRPAVDSVGFPTA